MESDRKRGGGFQPLSALIPELLPPARLPPLLAKRTKLEQLRQLEYELGLFLSTSAPDTWRDTRRTLWRLIRRARRELRAVERASCS